MIIWSVLRQHFHKYTSMTTDMHATVKNIIEMDSSKMYVLRLYNDCQ
jgi:hypothetical protein